MRPLCSEKPVAATMTMSVRESQMLEMQLSASGANGGCDIPYLKVLARDHDDSWEFPHSRFGQAMRRCLAIQLVLVFMPVSAVCVSPMRRCNHYRSFKSAAVVTETAKSSVAQQKRKDCMERFQSV